MSDKNVMFVVTTNGSGAHMMREVFVAMGFSHLSSNPMRFWPIYLMASENPDRPCPRRFLEGRQPVTNLEALRNIYASWGYQLDDDQLCSEPLAKRIFGEILCNRISEPNLLMVHDREYIQPQQIDDNPNVLSWSQEHSDQAFRLLVQSLNDAPLNAKYLNIVRHPVDLYISTFERMGDRQNHKSRMIQIESFFRRVAAVKNDQTVDSLFLKYEDLCYQPDQYTRNIIDWSLSQSDQTTKDTVWNIVRKIPQKRPKGLKPQTLNEDDTSLLKELTQQNGYTWLEKPGKLLTLKSNLRRYCYDVGLTLKLMSGNLNSSAVLRHHKLSRPAAVLLKLLRCIPALSRRWDRIPNAELDNLGTGVENPDPWAS